MDSGSLRMKIARDPASHREAGDGPASVSRDAGRADVAQRTSASSASSLHCAHVTTRDTTA